MDLFHLPDLGEGLPDAEIHAWFVAEGDTVKAFQPIVSMETAKALVDVPSPQDGVIKRLYGQPGDIIKTGAPLVGFEVTTEARPDQGTVVGHLEESHEPRDDHFVVQQPSCHHARPKATPSVRLLAKQLNVALDTVIPTGEHGVITREDIEHAAPATLKDLAGFEPLRGVRRAMQDSMTHSHQHVVPVSVYDEADITAWLPKSDITVRLIRALVHACQIEPALNAWFDDTQHARRCFDELHLGLAMDHADGLFVPVIHNVANLSDDQLRQTINDDKHAVQTRTLKAEQLQGATFTLSNFGKFAGRFASPIVVPPSVAILAVGRCYEGACVHQGEIKARRLLPLSLSFDHRVVTGGEATRFLGALMHALQQPTSD